MEVNVRPVTMTMIEQVCRGLGVDDVVVIGALGEQGPQLLEQALAVRSDGHILVLYDSADHAIARGFAASSPSAVSLVAWKKRVAALLSLYRRNRRRVFFARLAGIEADPAGFQASLAKHLGVPDVAPKPEQAAIDPVWTAWQSGLAYTAASDDAVVRDLERELEVASLPLVVARCDADRAVAEIRQFEERITELHTAEEERTSSFIAIAQKQMDLEEERDLLMQQLRFMHDATLDEDRKAADAQDSLSKAHQEIAEKRRLISRLREQLAERESASELEDNLVNGSNDPSWRYDVAKDVGEVATLILQSPGWRFLPLPAKMLRRWQYNVVDKSGLVDSEWYLQYYPDVAEAQMSAIRHYIMHGAQEGRIPNSRYV